MIDIKKTYRCAEDQGTVTFIGESGPFIFGTVGVLASYGGITAVIWMKDDGRVCCSSGNSLCMGLIEIKPAAIDQIIAYLMQPLPKDWEGSSKDDVQAYNDMVLRQVLHIKAEAEKEG